MKKIFALLLFCHVACGVKHSLKYFLTATSGVPNFPEFAAAVVLDEVLLGYCDSIRTAEPKQDWMSKFIKDNPQHLEWYVNHCSRSQHFFRANIDSLMERLNQTGGAHILQRMNGCEWDDETGDITGFNQYGYDGEDFIALDLQTLTWIAPKPQAFITKLRWDAEKTRLQFNKNYLNHECPDWLKTYVDYERSFLQRTDLPSVSLLQKTASSPVTCHATGFYPDRADLFWTKDGEELHEDVDKGEILPNHDGSFQMSVDLKVSSIAPEDWEKYHCVFQLSGVKDDIRTRLYKAAILPKHVPGPSGFPVGAAVALGVVGGLLVLAACIAAFVIWRKKYSGFSKASNSDTSSSSAEDPDLKKKISDEQKIMIK